MLRRFRSSRARRRLDRRSGYGAGYGCERLLIRDSRQWVCRQARGPTLELAVGTGLNLRWYPRDIDLVAVDLSREGLDIVAERARELGRPVRLAVADGHHLPFGNDTFETVVCTLAICDVANTPASRWWSVNASGPGTSNALG